MTISSELGNQPPLEYLVAMLHRSSWWLHKEEVIRVIERDKKGALPLLLQGLKSERYEVRIRATLSLGYIGDEQVIEPILQMLFDENDSVRSTVPVSIALIGKPAVPFLIDILEKVAVESKKYIFDAFGAIRDVRAIESLLKYLTIDDERTRFSAIEALAKIGEPTISPLIKAGQNSELQQPVMLVFSKFRDKTAVEPLLSLLKNSEGVTKLFAACGLAHIQDSKAIEPIVETLDGESEALRAKIVRIIGIFNYDDVLPHLNKMLNADSIQVRLAVIDALGMNHRKAVPQLVELLQFPEIAIKKKVASILEHIHDERALDALVFATEDLNLEVQEAAILALQWYKEPKLVDVLLPVFLKSTGKVKVAAAKVLCHYKDDRLVAPFMAVLMDSDKDLREIAALAMGHWDVKQAFEDLLKLLSDTEESVRCAAIQALGLLDNPLAVEPLIQLFDSATSDECYYLATALCRLADSWSGEVQTISPLLKAYKRHLQGFLGHTEEEYCRNCEELECAIGRFSRVLSPLLLEWFEEDISMRLYSIHFLGESKDKKAYEPLLSALYDFEFPSHVIEALYSIDEIRTTDLIIQLLKNSPEMIILEATALLGFSGNFVAVEPFLKLLNRKLSYTEEEAIIEALGRIGDKRAIPNLLNFKEIISDYHERYDQLKRQVDEAITALSA